MRLLFQLLLVASVQGLWAQSWEPRNDFLGGARDDGTTFTVNNEAFCGTGRNAGFTVTNDFYAFDLTTEQWTQVASLPDSARRQYATAVTYANNGFLFGGINAQGEFLNDLWNYDPVSDFWDYLGDAPFVGRSGMQSFVIGDEMFVVGGKTATSVAVNEVWAYDFSTNAWSQKNDLPSEGIWRGFDAVYNDVGIVGMGTDSTNTKRGEVYFYDASLDFWLEMTALQTAPMNYPAASQIDDRIYVYGGEDVNSNYSNDFRFLDLTAMTWYSSNSFTETARRGSMAFTSATDFFITTGLTTTQRLDETWVARNVVSISEIEGEEKIVVYGADGVLNTPESWENCSIINALGQERVLKRLENGKFELPTNLPTGIYSCITKINGGVERSRFYLE